MVQTANIRTNKNGSELAFTRISYLGSSLGFVVEMFFFCFKSLSEFEYGSSFMKSAVFRFHMHCFKSVIAWMHLITAAFPRSFKA